MAVYNHPGPTELLESVYKLGGKGKKQVGELMLKCSSLLL